MCSHGCLDSYFYFYLWWQKKLTWWLHWHWLYDDDDDDDVDDDDEEEEEEEEEEDHDNDNSNDDTGYMVAYKGPWARSKHISTYMYWNTGFQYLSIVILLQSYNNRQLLSLTTVTLLCIW